MREFESHRCRSFLFGRFVTRIIPFFRSTTSRSPPPRNMASRDCLCATSHGPRRWNPPPHKPHLPHTSAHAAPQFHHRIFRDTLIRTFFFSAYCPSSLYALIAFVLFHHFLFCILKRTRFIIQVVVNGPRQLPQKWLQSKRSPPTSSASA